MTAVPSPPHAGSLADSKSSSELSVEYAPECEIRLAIVMYGGVSLAIYMYGVAQELLNLVKATAPAVPGSSDPGGLAFPEDETTLPVYRKLARLLGRRNESTGPVRARFVVDLVSGSSAGGLNGVCLATVLANDRPGADSRLEPLEELWVRHGDLDTLFAGKDSELDDTGALDPELAMPQAPPSLLNGLRFYKLLAQTLHDQLAQEGGEDALRSRLVDQLDLWVTATDLDGSKVKIPIKNAVVSERQHAYRFHFAYDPVQQQNDFTKDAAPFVAFAGRSTSSFPVAFEPMRLGRIVHYPLASDWASHFYPDREPDEFLRTPLSDGGILDNKPFSYATQELARRPATLPVERYLVYVEPDPKPVADEPRAKEWSALETALAALTGIPRSETIRGDLELVRQRNQAIRRARRLLSESALSPAQQQQTAKIVPRLERERWLAMGFEEMVAAEAQFGPTYPVYHRLKVSAVCDYLARLLARALDVDDDGAEMSKLRATVDVWRGGRYQEEPAPHAPGESFPRTESEFLFRFDMPFRIRRLTYVLSRLRELESENPARIEGFFRAADSASVPELEHSEIREIRRRLSGALNRLVELEQRLPRDASLRESLRLCSVDAASLTVMDGSDEDALRDQVPQAIARDGNPFDSIIHDAIQDVTEQARAAVEATLGVRHTEDEVERRLQQGGNVELRRAVRFHYDAFEAFDLVYLPLSYETAVADTNPITIVRVSPIDASRPTGVSKGLRGSALHHFAAFTDSSWRQHDIAWGRLNASEILIRNLLPAGHPEADTLIDEAHAAIERHYVETARLVPGRDTTAADEDGQPLLGDVPITDGAHWSGSVRRGAAIASATAQDQLRRKRQETAASAVELTTKAVEGAGALELASGLYGLMPAKAKKIGWTVTLVLFGLALVAFLASLLVDGWLQAALLVVSALALGILVGVVVLVLLGLTLAASRIRAIVLKTLSKF